jgi:putative endonuclease
MTPTGDRRRRAVRRGRWAETLAAWLLRLKGYSLLARDYRTAVGEVDILARRGQVLAAIEVKRRADLDHAAQSVQARQRRRIERAASAYLARLPDGAGLSLRFDVVLVARGRLKHIADAWRP